MASNLYEILGLDKSASPEDIRKAYKKKALATHPDRLPPNVSEAEKQDANERFRLVNNAYEVLNDASNRKLYDRYGVWPPPTATATNEAPPRRKPSARGPFTRAAFDEDPFSHHHHMPRFAFTDPFDLFNSFFGSHHHGISRSDPFFDDFFEHHSPLDSMFGSSPFQSHQGDPFGHSSLSPFGSGFPFGERRPFLEMMLGGMDNPGNVGSYSSVTQAVGSNGQWVSQSKMTRGVNGRTETIIKRRDAQGNEHVTYSSPEGERFTINGIDQPTPNSNRHFPPSMSNPAVTVLPADNYASTSSRREPQQIPVNYTQPEVAHYASPPQQEASSRHHNHVHHTSSRPRHHSTHSTREGLRARTVDDDSIRRSSSGRHYPDRDRADAAFQDPRYYSMPSPTRSTSHRSHHSHHSHHTHDRTSYADPLQPDAGAKYTADNFGQHPMNAYADPQPRTASPANMQPSNSRHSHERDHLARYADDGRPDEGHRRKSSRTAAHGW